MPGAASTGGAQEEEDDDESAVMDLDVAAEETAMSDELSSDLLDWLKTKKSDATATKLHKRENGILVRMRQALGFSCVGHGVNFLRDKADAMRFVKDHGTATKALYRKNNDKEKLGAWKAFKAYVKDCGQAAINALAFETELKENFIQWMCDYHY